VEFTNASIATAGISLNELEFPPHSGSNVAIDSGGPIDVTFSSPIDQFGGYFTYSTRLSLEAFGAGNTELGLVQSKFSSNLAISGVPGSSPNELLQFSSSQGIDSVLITGSSKGNSFAMDDIFVTTTPEPNYLLLLAGALAVAGVVAQKRK
jgi:hypothetical protein